MFLPNLHGEACLCCHASQFDLSDLMFLYVTFEQQLSVQNPLLAAVLPANTELSVWLCSCCLAFLVAQDL